MGREHHDVHGREIVLDVLSRRGLLGCFGVIGCVYTVGWLIGVTAPPMKSVLAFDAYGCAAPAAAPVAQGGTSLTGTPRDKALAATEPCAGVKMVQEGKAWEGEFEFQHRLDQFFFLYARVHNTDAEQGREVKVQTEVALSHRARGSTDDWKPLFRATGAGGGGLVRERTLTCHRGDTLCQPLLLAKQVSVESKRFKARVSLRPAPGTSGEGGLASFGGNVLIEVVSRSDAFAWYEGCYKYVLLLCSLIALALYGQRYFAVPPAERMLEQRWVFGLLCATPALNDVPYALQFFSAGVCTKLLSSLLQASFLAALLFFWLVTLGSVRAPPTRIGRMRFYVPKALLVGVFWLATAGAYAWAAWQATYEPSAVAAAPTSAALEGLRAIVTGHAAAVGPQAALELAAVACAAVYALWLFTIIMGTLGEVFTMSAHYTVTFFFTLAVIACTLTGLALGVLSPTHDEAAEFLSFLVLFNLYVWVMAFLYSPTLHATRTVTAARSALLTDPTKFSIDDDDDQDPLNPSAHDPSKFAI
mmetsp:Transcript_17064/g.46116  ORF Transcript_17064/g.46116 Transcript_17064/m.46116 type:complete len:530 (-) Transcript_17064:549-2138(-)